MTEAAVLAFPTLIVDEADPLEDMLAELTPPQKAAILVLQLGREESARVLSQLDETQLEQLSAEIARTGDVPPAVSAAVLDEFAALLAAENAPPARGGMQTARDLLTASVGAERGAAIAARVSSTFVELPFSFLCELDHRQITSFVSDEHPQTIALVLAHLPAELASHVLAGLSRELQADVAHRIAVMDRTSPDLIRQVESSLERRLSSLGVRSDLSAVGGLKPLVEIINKADSGTERMIMEGLDELDPELAEKIRGQMFLFEDVASLDDRTIQLVLRQVQTNDLATALKGVAEPVRAKLLKNMSERAALALSEQVDILGPVRLNVVEEARQNVIKVIRQMEADGSIVLSRGDADAFVA